MSCENPKHKDKKMKFALLSDNFKNNFKSFIQPFIRVLARYNISPNVYTTISLIFCAISGFYFSHGSLRMGAFTLLFGGLFDIFDGAIARASNRVTRFGALYDSTLDRYAEFFVFLGIAYYFFKRFIAGYVPGFYIVLTVFIAIFGSLMVSYVRARAEGLDFECKVGVLQRPERIILISVGALISEFTLIMALIIIAILANFTAFQRLYHIWAKEYSPKWKTQESDVEQDELV